jgi:hypothetical protein
VVPATVLAKVYPLAGTVECGVPSGQRCHIVDSVAVITKDFGGEPKRVVVDISWIKKYFEEQTFDQDDPICIEVDDDQSGHYQALRAHVECQEQGVDPD